MGRGTEYPSETNQDENLAAINRLVALRRQLRTKLETKRFSPGESIATVSMDLARVDGLLRAASSEVKDNAKGVGSAPHFPALSLPVKETAFEGPALSSFAPKKNPFSVDDLEAKYPFSRG
jgi:hypothetical protein